MTEGEFNAINDNNHVKTMRFYIAVKMILRLELFCHSPCFAFISKENDLDLLQRNLYNLLPAHNIKLLFW
ncbi:hypothetical protein PsalMR5_01946 [Piscirickettsia salmonis]|nr:hypothetical protein PsalSR1_02167 [Piscirickettsia salmonis]QGP59377.1 hypothetical protein PsalBI1_01965 [Piscirickettsia salmonis]QGP64081.1 hypothetical protein PsalMR5_01946 [Piscirickettsia salmonis]